MLGGRLGYVLFYKPEMLRDPLSIVRSGKAACPRTAASSASCSSRSTIRAGTRCRGRISAITCASWRRSDCSSAAARTSSTASSMADRRPSAWAVQFPKELFERDNAALAERAVDARARRSIQRMTTSRRVSMPRRRIRRSRRASHDPHAAAPVADLRSAARGRAVVPDSLVCAHAHAPAERRHHRPVPRRSTRSSASSPSNSASRTQR